jgi:hypothetical protein
MLKKGRECLDDNAHARPVLGFVLHAERCHCCKLQSREENHSEFKYVSSCFLGSDTVREGDCTAHRREGRRETNPGNAFWGTLSLQPGVNTFFYCILGQARRCLCPHRACFPQFIKNNSQIK